MRCRSDRRPPQGTRGPRCRKQIVLHIVLNAELHRYVLAARLFDAQAPIYSDKLPELLDVRLMAMSPLAFTLTGFERVAGVEYAQSWLVSNFGRAESGRFCLARVVRQRYSAMVRVRPPSAIHASKTSRRE